MHLTEQHRIDRFDPRWPELDTVCFASKHLYNAALYQMRQAYIFQQQHRIAYEDLDKLMQPTAEYRALPAKVAQQVLRQVCLAWKSYFASVTEYRKHPAKFLGHPKLPKYLDKQGRNVLVFTEQAISQAKKNEGWILPSGLDIQVVTDIPQDRIAQVRIVPKATHYMVEVVYEQAEDDQLLNPAHIAAVDIGVNTLATLTSNQPGFVPLLVNGRPLKSLNQWYNKRRAELQAALPTGVYVSRALAELTDYRQRAIMSYLHTASRAIINSLVGADIQVLVIGKNDGWKQEVQMGTRNNQTFVCIPHAKFIELLTYKAALVGIRVILIQESYTSKCSFLDGEAIGKHEQYAGKRIKRGLFRAGNGHLINADVNGSYNILCKACPQAFSPDAIAQVRRHPIALRLPDRQQAQHKQSRTLRATG